MPDIYIFSERKLIREEQSCGNHGAYKQKRGKVHIFHKMPLAHKKSNHADQETGCKRSIDNRG